MFYLYIDLLMYVFVYYFTFFFSVLLGCREQAVLTASNTGRSDPLHPADGQTVGPRPALLVYTFFLEEGFSPSRDR